MKLLYIKQGIKIRYNTNEYIDETIFALDSDNNIIQNTTFYTNIYPINQDDLNDIISQIYKTNNIVNVPKGFLFYSFAYQKSFVHYLTNNVPKLCDYINSYKDYKLLIPKHFYNNLCKDILELCNISISNVELLEDNTIYNIIDCVQIKHYEAPPSNFTENHLWIYRKIREKLNIYENSTPYKKIYLKRDNISNIDYGNDETGILRQIINEKDLIDKLIENGFEIITLGNKSITEKCDLLNNCLIIVTPLGANCMNLIFSNSPKHMIIVSNDRNFGHDYYTNISCKLNNSNINYKTFRYNSIGTDPLNYWNSSFSVNVDEIIENVNLML